MYIIAGLGNPGKQYENTRHNIGFMVIDALADAAGIDVTEKKHKAVIGKGMLAGEKCILAKPQTFMNLSGESIRELVDYYKIDETTQLIIISDDISLEVGRLRIRKKGSAGGHNGLKNIIAHLGNDGFMRLRVGIGEKPAGYDLADYVLGHFDAQDMELLKETQKRAVSAIGTMIEKGPDAAMNLYNDSKGKK